MSMYHHVNYHYVNISLYQNCLVLKFSIKLHRINHLRIEQSDSLEKCNYSALHSLPQMREGVWSYHHLQCWL